MVHFKCNYALRKDQISSIGLPNKIYKLIEEIIQYIVMVKHSVNHIPEKLFYFGSL